MIAAAVDLDERGDRAARSGVVVALVAGDDVAEGDVAGRRDRAPDRSIEGRAGSLVGPDALVIERRGEDVAVRLEHEDPLVHRFIVAALDVVADVVKRIRGERLK